MAYFCNGLNVKGHVASRGNTWEGNVGFGYLTLRSTNAAQQCTTAFGWKALYSTSLSGVHNSAFGAGALCQVTTGYYNTGIGKQAGRVITNGHQHTGIGRCALGTATSSQQHIAIGYMANYNGSTGYANLTIGYSSRTGNADRAMAIGSLSQACGTKATAIGWQANANNSHGTAIGGKSCAGPYATAVGYCARAAYDCSIALGSFSCVGNPDDIAIGYGASTVGYPPGTIMMGTGVNSNCNKIWTGWSYCSDKNEKSNIETLSYDHGLPLIKKLRPVKFNWDHRERYVEECGFEFGTKDGTLAKEREEYGIIAQELEQALTELNIRFDGLRKRGDKRYFLANTELIAPLVKSIQQLSTKLDTIKERITTLENV